MSLVAYQSLKYCTKFAFKGLFSPTGLKTTAKIAFLRSTGLYVLFWVFQHYFLIVIYKRVPVKTSWAKFFECSVNNEVRLYYK